LLFVAPAGIARVKDQEGDTKYRGRKPSYSGDQLATVRDMVEQSAGIGEIAKATGLSRQAIYRIKADPGSGRGSVGVLEGLPTSRPIFCDRTPSIRMMRPTAEAD